MLQGNICRAGTCQQIFINRLYCQSNLFPRETVTMRQPRPECTTTQGLLSRCSFCHGLMLVVAALLRGSVLGEKQDVSALSLKDSANTDLMAVAKPQSPLARSAAAPHVVRNETSDGASAFGDSAWLRHGCVIRSELCRTCKRLQPCTWADRVITTAIHATVYGAVSARCLARRDLHLARHFDAHPEWEARYAS